MNFIVSKLKFAEIMDKITKKYEKIDTFLFESLETFLTGINENWLYKFADDLCYQNVIELKIQYELITQDIIIKTWEDVYDFFIKIFYDRDRIIKIWKLNKDSNRMEVIKEYV